MEECRNPDVERVLMEAATELNVPYECSGKFVSYHQPPPAPVATIADVYWPRYVTNYYDPVGCYLRRPCCDHACRPQAEPTPTVDRQLHEGSGSRASESGNSHGEKRRLDYLVENGREPDHFAKKRRVECSPRRPTDGRTEDADYPEAPYGSPRRSSSVEKRSVFDRLTYSKEHARADYSSQNSGDNPLQGMIFGCTSTTRKECERLQLFGLPASNRDNVLRVEPGTPLFLFNYETKELSGVYEAKSYGKMNINKAAFREWGSFPAQVEVRRVGDFPDLPFDAFRPAIWENFYTERRFRYDLSFDQVESLLKLFHGASKD